MGLPVELLNRRGATVPTTLDRLSLSTVSVEPLFGDRNIGGNATAFVWQQAEKYYLITNWHVVTLCDANTGYTITNNKPSPNKLRALFNTDSLDYWKVTIDIPIRDHDDLPLWRIHQLHAPGKRIDIVVIPIDFDPKLHGIKLWPVNTIASIKLKMTVGMDVFILGYPFGSELPAFPVWKRGSLASEPELIGLDGTHYYLVDTASRPGMSGSPVILRSWKHHLLETGRPITTQFDDVPIDRFIGVFGAIVGPAGSSSDRDGLGRQPHRADYSRRPAGSISRDVTVRALERRA